MKEKYITAIIWYFGFNKKEAIAYINIATPEILSEILKCYKSNFKIAFYND